jgi:mono/diheme cytochrome c family protein
MRLPIAGLGLAAIALIAAADAAPPSATPRPPEKVYAVTCGYCHGRNVGPVILGRQLPPDAIKAIVRHGQNAMPAFRPTEISNAELDAVAKWVSTSAPKPEEHGQ